MNRIVQKSIFLVVLGVAFFSCSTEKIEKEKELVFESKMIEMTDESYPDNNDIESRCSDWEKYKHHEVSVNRLDSTNFKITFPPSNDNSDTIVIENINLLEWIPTIPNYLTDEYLKSIGIINAEWNRQQVKFTKGEFYISNHTEEGRKTIRVDLARNCLNSYLWELITYAEDGALYHGWFDFPRGMYEELFDEVNHGKLTFEEYRNYLIDYKDPASELVNLDNVRKVDSAWQVSFNNLNHEFYPLTGARKSKFKNIVHPKNPTTINDFLTDSTMFSTFLYPGYYSTSDPRHTTLSKLGIPKNVTVRKVISNNKAKDVCLEFDITFASNKDTTELTRIVIGGVKESQIPTLALNDYNKGYKMPMGIGNHGFYEKAAYAQAHSSLENPYYAFILDGDGKWMDSHFFGIDGPIFHRDENDSSLMHYWLLSFERHAMVTHLTFKID